MFPLILLVPVAGMSQNTNTLILGLTKANYNAPRMSNKAHTNHKSIKQILIILYKTV